jgi:hypothetical protein
MAGRIDKVDDEVAAVSLLREGEAVRLRPIEEEGDTGRLDSNATILFVLTSVSQALVASAGNRDNSGSGDKGVGEGGLAVI